MDIIELIMQAKIGRERKEAQLETCAAFAAALYDVLEENGFDVRMVTAARTGVSASMTWYHSVVEVDGRFYDSMGEFSTEIVRKRNRIHPSVGYELSFKPDTRDECFDADDYQALYEFLLKELRKSARKMQTKEAATVNGPR